MTVEPPLRQRISLRHVTPQLLTRISFIALFLCVLPLVAAPAQYPEIQSLSRTDFLYEQLQDDIERFYRESHSDGTLPKLVIYQLDPQGFDSLISLAARLGLPYSSLATLNRLEHSQLSDNQSSLLVPNTPGLFVPVEPGNELERLMTELRSPEHTRNGNRNDTQDTQKQARNEVQKVSVILEGEPVTFHFFPGEDFDRVERLSFLNILFRRPVRNVRISSAFGWRKSPVTGLRSFHGGVDFPASTGTEVVASRDGKVVDVGTDSWYGKYVIIDHSGGYRTFYAHLDATVVELNEVVSSGKIIGRVGSTGMSTGPHLHFEIRMDGIPRDPVRHLPGLKR